MMSSTLEYWVRLGLAFGSGNDRTDAIIRQFGGAEHFYREHGMRKIERLTPTEKARLATVSMDDAKRVIEKADKIGADMLTPDDPRYPQRLLGIWGTPCVLYVDGSIDGIDNHLAMAMVGTRRCSDYGFRAAVKIASELSRAGAIIVSGLALGIDTACHTAAVKEDAPTVAVLGCGIDRTYPASNATLRELITRHGAIITEYAPGTEPQASHFPKRNRIISGLSVGVVVVEAGLRSGSLITAGQAAEQGRDVFAVPGDIFRASSEGTFQLLQQGCTPVCCGADILEEYRYRFTLKLEPEQKKTTRAKRAVMPDEGAEQIVLHNVRTDETPAPELDGLARTVYELLGAEGARTEELACRLEKPVHAVLAVLTELELTGFVQACAGGRYMRGVPHIN